MVKQHWKMIQRSFAVKFGETTYYKTNESKHCCRKNESKCYLNIFAEIEPVEPSKENQDNGPVVPLEPVEVPAKGDDTVGKAPVPDANPDKVSSYFGASGTFVHGFIATLSVILVSELGDKTFFIGELLAASTH